LLCAWHYQIREVKNLMGCSIGASGKLDFSLRVLKCLISEIRQNKTHSERGSPFLKTKSYFTLILSYFVLICQKKTDKRSKSIKKIPVFLMPRFSRSDWLTACSLLPLPSVSRRWRSAEPRHFARRGRSLVPSVAESNAFRSYNRSEPGTLLDASITDQVGQKMQTEHSEDIPMNMGETVCWIPATSNCGTCACNETIPLNLK
jgi:hypothetical protein